MKAYSEDLHQKVPEALARGMYKCETVRLFGRATAGRGGKPGKGSEAALRRADVARCPRLLLRAQPLQGGYADQKAPSRSSVPFGLQPTPRYEVAHGALIDPRERHDKPHEKQRRPNPPNERKVHHG